MLAGRNEGDDTMDSRAMTSRARRDRAQLAAFGKVTIATIAVTIAVTIAREIPLNE